MSILSFRFYLLIALLTAFTAGGYLLIDWRGSARAPDHPRNFVGRDACISCHQEQAQLFHGSHHDKAMDLATDQTVQANFENQELEHFGIVSKMFRDGKKFMVRTDGPDGNLADFEVKYVFGHHPLQQFMVEIDRPADAKDNEIGRVQVLRLSWDIDKKKWFYLMPPDVSTALEHTDPLHWTGSTQNWNSSCAYCHSTNLKKNFDPISAQYKTTFQDIDVSCEACHGPGSLHLELANRNSLFWDRNHGFGLAKLKTETNQAQVETCAQCHSRRIGIADNFQGGCNYDDYFSLQLLTDPIYHHDGQIRDENFVYGSFIQSRMYHNGIRCSDCHDPHSLKLKHEGNMVCTSCHQHPSGKYDTVSHHHHTPGKPGSFCVDCHMPETTYMMCDPRRDHSFRVPRPDLSVNFDTPNACTGCHLDEKRLQVKPDRKPLAQYLDWILAAKSGDSEIKTELDRVDQEMLAAIRKWYPDQLDPKSKYYDQLTIGQSGKNETQIQTLALLAKDRTAPAIFRASALEVLGYERGHDSLKAALEGLDDPEPKVIAAALVRIDLEINQQLARRNHPISTSSANEELQKIVKRINKLISSDSRRVRIDAARILLGIPTAIRVEALSIQQQTDFENALKEYRSALISEQDRAPFQMALANLAELTGDEDQAANHYRTAMKIDPHLAGPRANLANVLESQISRLEEQLSEENQNADQESHRKRVRIQIDKLKMQVDELRRQEHGLLAKDIERAADIPGTHALHYQFAMSCYLQKDLESCEKHLLEAHRQDSNEPVYLVGLASYYLHVKKMDEARKFISRLIQMAPDNIDYQNLWKQADGQN